VYRAELEANLDLNPALAELMFARHLMNKLEAHVFALREEDAMKVLISHTLSSLSFSLSVSLMNYS
jgi:hypothetical protein